MGLTVWPNDNGTITILQNGSEVDYDLDDVARCGLSLGEKAFLRSMFQHAVPGPTACPVGRKKQ